MIKKILIAVLLISVMLLVSGCGNKDIDLFQHPKDTKAYINMGGQTVMVNVDRYLSGSNGVVNIYDANGTFYKTHFVNVVLVRNNENEQTDTGDTAD